MEFGRFPIVDNLLGVNSGEKLRDCEKNQDLELGIQANQVSLHFNQVNDLVNVLIETEFFNSRSWVGGLFHIE